MVGDGWTIADIEAAVEAGEYDDLIRVPIWVSMDPPDCEWAQQLCIRLSGHSDPQVRANTILGFGHLARTCGRLNERVVRPLIEAALRQPSPVRGQAEAAADDVEHFLGWKVSRVSEA